MSKTRHRKQPSWLKHVQEQSWEPELLISGLILFALFQTPDLIDMLSRKLEWGSEFFANSTVNETIATLLKISVYVLIFGFLTHILLRSIWVAYGGLSYLFKDGIDFSRLNLPDMYTRPFKKSPMKTETSRSKRAVVVSFQPVFFFYDYPWTDQCRDNDKFDITPNT